MAILTVKVQEAKREAKVASITERKNSCIAACESAIATLTAIKATHNDKAVIRQLSTAKDFIATIARSSPVSGQKKRFARMNNTVASYTDALSSGEVSRATIEKMRVKVLEVCTEEKPRLEGFKATAATTDEVDEPNDHGDRNAEYLDLISKEVTKIKGKYANVSQQLRALHNRPFILARVPIVPLLVGTAFFNLQKLQNAGMQAERIGEYAILEDQLILGINPAHLDALHKKFKKKGIEIAEHLVQLVEAKTKHKHIIMGPALRHSTGFYYWIPTQVSVDRMSKAVVGHFSIKKWGFAFNEN